MNTVVLAVIFAVLVAICAVFALTLLFKVFIALVLLPIFVFAVDILEFRLLICIV